MLCEAELLAYPIDGSSIPVLLEIIKVCQLHIGEVARRISRITPALARDIQAHVALIVEHVPSQTGR